MLVLAQLDGRPADAVDGLRIGITRPDLHLPGYRLGDLGGRLARALAELGQRSEALSEARAARERLERWPGYRRDELDVLIARLDRSGTGAPGQDDGTILSPHEREVAALLAEGLSNAELASRLYISPRTAAVHVSNILAKLGMSSRAEVAAWAVRTGLAGEATPA